MARVQRGNDRGHFVFACPLYVEVIPGAYGNRGGELLVKDGIADRTIRAGEKFCIGPMDGRSLVISATEDAA